MEPKNHAVLGVGFLLAVLTLYVTMRLPAPEHPIEQLNRERRSAFRALVLPDLEPLLQKMFGPSVQILVETIRGPFESDATVTCNGDFAWLYGKHHAPFQIQATYHGNALEPVRLRFATTISRLNLKKLSVTLPQLVDNLRTGSFDPPNLNSLRLMSELLKPLPMSIWTDTAAFRTLRWEDIGVSYVDVVHDGPWVQLDIPWPSQASPTTPSFRPANPGEAYAPYMRPFARFLAREGVWRKVRLPVPQRRSRDSDASLVADRLWVLDGEAFLPIRFSMDGPIVTAHIPNKSGLAKAFASDANRVPRDPVDGPQELVAIEFPANFDWDRFTLNPVEFQYSEEDKTMRKSDHFAR